MPNELLNGAGRRRSPSMMPGFHSGRPPRNKGPRLHRQQGASRRLGRELRLKDHDGSLHRAARGVGIEVLVRLSPSAP